MEGTQEEPEGRPGGMERGKRARGIPPGCFKVQWSSWPSFWLFLGSLEVHQAILISTQQAIQKPKSSIGTFKRSRRTTFSRLVNSRKRAVRKLSCPREPWGLFSGCFHWFSHGCFGGCLASSCPPGSPGPSLGAPPDLETN